MQSFELISSETVDWQLSCLVMGEHLKKMAIHWGFRAPCNITYVRTIHPKYRYLIKECIQNTMRWLSSPFWGVSAARKASFHILKLSVMKNVLKEVYKETRDVTFKNLKCWFGISNQTIYWIYMAFMWCEELSRSQRFLSSTPLHLHNGLVTSKHALHPTPLGTICSIISMITDGIGHTNFKNI